MTRAQVRKDGHISYIAKSVLIMHKSLKNILLIQSNLVNSRSWGLEILFQSIESSNDREIDIKIYNPPKMIIISFFPIKHLFCA